MFVLFSNIIVSSSSVQNYKRPHLLLVLCHVDVANQHLAVIHDFRRHKRQHRARRLAVLHIQQHVAKRVFRCLRVYALAERF